MSSYDDGSGRPLPRPSPRPNWSRINQWLLWVGLATAVGWLYFRHGEHLLQLLPFLFVLACPLMHLFGHGGHGRHGGHRSSDRERDRPVSGESGSTDAPRGVGRPPTRMFTDRK